MRTSSWILPGILVCLVLNSSTATAQVEVVGRTSGSRQIVGRILDVSTGQAVASADVVLRDSTDRLVATALGDETGLFRLIPKGTGTFRLTVSRIGYSPTKGTVEYAGEGTLLLKVSLASVPVEVEGVEAVGRARSAHMEMNLAGFTARKARGAGFFIDQAEIERKKPTRITDLLVRIPSVHVLRKYGRPVDVMILHAQGVNQPGAFCLPSVWLDGVQVRAGGVMRGTDVGAGGALNDMAFPEEIGGIEVYTHVARIPVQFRDSRSMCGVLAIWSRR